MKEPQVGDRFYNLTDDGIVQEKITGFFPCESETDKGERLYEICFEDGGTSYEVLWDDDLAGWYPYGVDPAEIWAEVNFPDVDEGEEG